jgi:hypothetical protein
VERRCFFSSEFRKTGKMTRRDGNKGSLLSLLIEKQGAGADASKEDAMRNRIKLL